MTFTIAHRAPMAILAMFIAVAGCSPDGGRARLELVQTEAAEPAVDGDSSMGVAWPSAGGLPSVPEQFVGSWVYSHEVCEPDAESEPSARKISAQIDLQPDFSYGMTVEGFFFSGRYRVEKLSDGYRLQLDNWLNFTPVGDTLENWSEGDAPYACGRIFVRG